MNSEHYIEWLMEVEQCAYTLWSPSTWGSKSVPLHCLLPVRACAAGVEYVFGLSVSLSVCPPLSGLFAWSGHFQGLNR